MKILILKIRKEMGHGIFRIITTKLARLLFDFTLIGVYFCVKHFLNRLLATRAVLRHLSHIS